MTNVAVLVVHGIGWHQDGTDRGILERSLTRLMDPPKSVDLLSRALRAAAPDLECTIKLAHWGKKVEEVQRRFEDRYRGLRWDTARRIVISALGDAAQYEAAVYTEGATTFPAHATIHTVVAEALAELAAKCGPDAPLVAIGHSLGGHILSNHIYDEQRASEHGKSRCHGGGTPLERMQTLRAFVTLGCNIPIFVMGTTAPKPIALGRARWLNYFDPDDVLGFPLRPLYFPDGDGQDYALEDIPVEVGGQIAGRTPASHGFYWDNDVVVRGIVDRIREAARSPRSV